MSERVFDDELECGSELVQEWSVDSTRHDCGRRFVTEVGSTGVRIDEDGSKLGKLDATRRIERFGNDGEVSRRRRS
jgi:hypothetical protein